VHTIFDAFQRACCFFRRLFLDYHGLKILHNWMSELGDGLADLDLKITVEDTLASLNIPHKTMLVDSLVWRTVNLWADPNKSISEAVQPQLPLPMSTDSSRATTPIEKLVAE
jgi:hypothetical protein